MNDTAVIIPARVGSTRLFRKLLLPVPDITSRKFLLQLTYEAAEKVFPSNVFVATEDEEVIDAVSAFGGRFLRTEKHENGTKRVAEAASKLPMTYQTIVNLQGDYPEIDGNLLKEVASKTKYGQIVTAACPFTSITEWSTDSAVKVVVAANGNALYFSRMQIPWMNKDDINFVDNKLLGKHIGIYAFNRQDLRDISNIKKPSALEEAEKLEQLTWLYWGWEIKVILTDIQHYGIDTPYDYSSLLSRLAQRQIAASKSESP